MLKPIKMPWQKGFRKIPPHIVRRLRSIESNEVIVTAVKNVTYSSVELGMFDHMGFSMQDGQLIVQPMVMPSPQVGKASKLNLYGKEVILKELGTYKKTYSFEAPNFGDPRKGFHDHSWTRDVYHRDIIPPRDNHILVEVIERREHSSLVRFTIDETMSMVSSDFDVDLLFNLNLLQENTGVCDLCPSATTLEEFLNTTVVEWEILPPDTRDDNLRCILSGVRVQRDQEAVCERYDILSALKPKQIIKGRSGFNRYFGAMFEDDLVVFENLDYGNAIYVMYEDWETLSQKTRLQLRNAERDGFEIIEHRGEWQKKIARIVYQHRSESV